MTTNTSSTALDSTTLFEDADLVVISKPPGIVVNDADSVSSPTIQKWFWQRLQGEKPIVKKEWDTLIPEDFSDEYGTPEEIFKLRQGIVHRLDKDTSGVMVLAKNPGSLVHLLAQFRNRETKKTYQCLTHGIFRVPEGIIDAPIGRSRQDRKKWTVTEEGREATTEYKVLQEYRSSNNTLPGNLAEVFANKHAGYKKQALNTYQQGFSLVECYPKTGRTHQIRVHLAHWGHPLVGDSTYAGKKRARLDALWCKRQFLHAYQLEFEHPRTGEKMRVRAKLSEDLGETRLCICEDYHKPLTAK